MEVNEMKRVTVLVPVLALLMLFAVAPAISVVHACPHTPPIIVTGTVTAGSYTITGQKTVDGNTFLTGRYEGDTFTGTFDGTASNVFFIILNPSGLHLLLFFAFTGTVNGIPGTLVIMFVGKGEGLGMPITGKWVILSGTGGLANLHGKLSVEGIAGVILTYKGNIHFDP
jgi:hypothetical protein